MHRQFNHGRPFAPVDLASLAAVTQRNSWVGDPTFCQNSDVDDDLSVTTHTPSDDLHDPRSRSPDRTVQRHFWKISVRQLHVQRSNKDNRLPFASLFLPMLNNFLINHFRVENLFDGPHVEFATTFFDGREVLRDADTTQRCAARPDCRLTQVHQLKSGLRH